MAVAEAPESDRYYCTPEEYLEREHTASFRSQYVAGRIEPMAVASEEHNDIVVNLSALLREPIRTGGGKVFTNDARIRTNGACRYAYPDVVVFAGERIRDAVDRGSFINPTVIVEVLSDSTEREDRVGKYDSYRTLEALQEYVLVDQYTPRIERFWRTVNGIWEHLVVTGLDSSINLESVGCVLNLRDIYEDIDFDAAGGDGSSDEVEDKTQG